LSYNATGWSLQHGQDVQCRNTLSLGNVTERAISGKICARSQGACLREGSLAPPTSTQARFTVNCMMANAMDGCAPTALQHAVEHIGTIFGGDLALLPTKVRLSCSKPPRSTNGSLHLTSIRQGRQCISAQSTSKARTSERRTHRVYLLYSANRDIGVQVLGHKGS
jgi:hypothetical protein